MLRFVTLIVVVLGIAGVVPVDDSPRDFHTNVSAASVETSPEQGHAT